jgi:predicted amidohydrolase YtcJ
MTPIDGKADTILSGGPIWCGLAQGTAEALALRGGKVLAAGRLSDVETLAGPGTRRIDLRGRLAIPAFHDAHMHLMSLGRRAKSLDISPGAVSTVADIVQLVGARAQSLAPGTWITGSGYDHDRMVGKRHPTRWDLDKVSPDHPVWLGRCCGHMGVANSAALKLAGISRDTPNPPGGVIVRENGEPTGLLQERAQEAMHEAMPAPKVEELVEAIELAGQRCLSYGIGSVMDACVGMIGGWSDVAAYEAAEHAPGACRCA